MQKVNLWLAMCRFVRAVLLKIQAFLRGRQYKNDRFTLKKIAIRAF
jgi:hypothetical protein